MIFNFIKKRNGKKEKYDKQKIERSISKAITASGTQNNDLLDSFTENVEKYLISYSKDDSFTTDDIRSAINIVLLENNLPEVAKIYFQKRGKKLKSIDNKKLEVKQIKKRDGSIVNFNEERIFKALLRAGESTEEFGGEEAKKLSNIVLAVLEHKFDGHEIPSVEQIQDIIEIILIQANWAKTAKAFIIYRESRRKTRIDEGVEIISEEVKELLNNDIYLTKSAENILNNSQQFDELGRIIFLDRYSLKDKRENIEKGDLIILVTKEDRKYPKKDLGIVKEIDGDDIKFYILTGVYADKENNFEFTQDIHQCDKPIESINDAHRRIAKAVSSIEKEDAQREKYFDLFFEQLQKKHIQPAGRIMTGANVDKHGKYTSNLTLFNCYVIPSPRDSRKAIVKDALYQMIEVMSRGGGVGMSLSALRPKYAYVRGVHGKSSGSTSWGGLFSFATGLIEQGGSRRGALMLMQWDWHPDILDFIESKTAAGQIENANISVMISDAFINAVKKDADWDLEFPDYENSAYSDVYDKIWNGDLHAWKKAGLPTRVYKTIKARDLWNKLIASAHASAEPGIVFMERYNKLSNSYYFNTLAATNPCGEQGLPPWGVCNLGHLYLGSFAEQIGEDELGPLYNMDWEALKRSAKLLTRFLDNIIDLTPYFFEENKDNQKNERRIGGGTLGLGELLIKLRMKYGSKESIKFIDKLYETITTEMYKESSNLAKEKGVFPKFEKEKYLESEFIKTLPKDIIENIKENGIRNVALTTQAPTGTVGTMLGTSTGIEPYYAFKFFRQSRLGFHEVLIPLAEQYKFEDDKLPEFFTSSMELTPIEHVEVQATIQRWTDSSISKTANAPSDFTIEQTKELYEKAYELGCKGLTIYRDNSRNEQVLSIDKNTEEKNTEHNNEEKVIPFAKEEKKIPKIKKYKEEKEDIKETKEIKQESNKVYGSEIGNICPQCEKGVMIKIGGCTECSKQCGFKGSCDMK